MLNKKTTIATLLVLGSTISAVCYADPVIYKTVKKNGEVVYSDRMPASEKGEYAILSAKSGVLKANVERELDKSEVAVLEAKNLENKKAVEANDMQKRKDTALLSTYSNVAEIEKMKKFELNQIDQSIKTGIDVVANIKDRISQNQENMKVAPTNKKLQEQAQKLNAELENGNKTLDYNKDLLSKRNAKYDEDKARYEQIVKNMVATSNGKDN